MNPKRASLRIPRDTAYLALVRRMVVELARSVGFTPKSTAEVEMAVDEAASNAIRHATDSMSELALDAGAGGGSARPDLETISVEAVADRDGITVTVADGGAPFSFERCGVRDLESYHAERSAGGLGVFIIKRFMDEVEYVHRPETGNELRMRKYKCPTSTS